MVYPSKHIFYCLSFFFLFGFSYLRVNAQNQALDADVVLTKALETDQLLPLLTDAALKSSPQIKMGANAVDVAVANLKVNKNAIYSGASLMSSYSYGTNYSAVNNPNGGLNNTNTFTTAQSGFYSLGAGLQLSIVNVLNRKHIIKAGQAQINIAQAQQENINLVIRQYQEFKLAKKLLTLSANSLQASQSNHMIAEKQFLQGQITIEQVSGVLSNYNSAKAAYETALNKFQTVYMQLETYVGVNLTTLLQQIK
jgi:outer membrane protein TolC